MPDIQLSAIERDLRSLARHQNGCRALMAQYGMGELSALVTLVELGAVQRMHASRQAVRMAGLTSACTAPTATRSSTSSPAKARRDCGGALFEAAQSVSHRASPDYVDYHALKERGLSHNRRYARVLRIAPGCRRARCRVRAAGG